MKRVYTFVVSCASLALVLALVFMRGTILKALSGTPDTFSCDLVVAENQALRSARSFGFTRNRRYFEADLYSKYPFNDKEILVIDAGSDDGMKVGMPVFLRENILIGRISSIKKTQSEVETIFNSSWRSSVFIGSRKIKAVLRGGKSPILELVPKNAVLEKGDSVANSSPNFPLGAYIGTVLNIYNDGSDLWFTADVDTGYSIQDARSVFVIADFQ
ncbi:MAG: rod shape-determining protein MreC [Patescibacteria group bacterium]